MSLRVSVLGYGAIGSQVASILARSEVGGAELVGIVTRTPGRATERGHVELDLAAALQTSDIIVECAGTEAVTHYGPAIIASGIDLLITSVGALVDDGLRRVLLQDGPGHSYLTAGAIGGLDLLGAAALGGGLDSVSLLSVKKAGTLIQPRMDAATVEKLRSGSKAVTVFDGGILEAIQLFPASLNVAVALAAATGMWEKTTVELVADPDATFTTHTIRAGGAAGQYSFTISNRPHPDNPATSGLVPSAILHGLSRLATPSGSFL